MRERVSDLGVSVRFTCRAFLSRVPNAHVLNMNLSEFPAKMLLIGCQPREHDRLVVVSRQQHAHQSLVGPSSWQVSGAISKSSLMSAMFHGNRGPVATLPLFHRDIIASQFSYRPLHFWVAKDEDSQMATPFHC